MSYTLNFVADFGSLTGLTLNAKLYDDTGAQTGATITTGMVEIGNGIYTYKHTTIPDAHRGAFVMYKSTDATIKVGFSVNPEEAELALALTTTTFAELTAVPAATSTLKDKINWLFVLARNKITQTNINTKLRNDADSGDIANSAVSDDGSTFTRSEWS